MTPAAFFVALTLVASRIYHVHGYIVGAAIIPHGDFAFDPTLVPGSWGIHNASIKAGNFINDLQPDILVLTTPHGMALDSQFALYGDFTAGGFANIGQDLHKNTTHTYVVSVNVTLAKNLTATLSNALGQSATKLSLFAGSEQTPLRWGEVIPLSFVPTMKHLKVIVISLPNRRHDGSGATMTNDLLKFGAELFHFFNTRDERTAMILSSDLAHTHSEIGPYGFTHAAGPFDAAIRHWAADPVRNSGSLLRRAKALVPRALSCGYPSLVIWHAMLIQLPRSHWDCELLAYAAPTYYGMIVATYRNIEHVNLEQWKVERQEEVALV